MYRTMMFFVVALLGLILIAVSYAMFLDIQRDLINLSIPVVVVTARRLSVR